MALVRCRSAVLVAVLLVVAATTSWALAVPAARAADTQTVVTLTFDDGDADQYPAQRTMAAHDLVGTFYVTTGWVDRPGHLTRDQVMSMARDGNEIGGHTVTHPDLTELPLPEVRAEICNSRSALESWGLRPTSFAYPFMRAVPAVEQIAAECGYLTARGLGDVVTHDSCGECPYAETMPPGDPQYLKTPAQVESSWTLDDLKATVTNAVDHGGGWVVLTFHHVCGPAGTGTCPVGPSTTPAVFAAFSAWLDAFRDDPANRTVVQTVDQTVRQYLGGSYPAYQPAAAVTPRPPAPRGVNGLTNASVEDLDPGSGFPSCWQPGGWGENTARWATVTPGRSGDRAQQVRITDYRTGDAKLLPTNDVHTCSPTVEPGRSYELSVWYRSTGRSQFALYLRTGSYAWTNWQAGPWLEPTATPGTWTRATFVTPPVPAGATGLSFGLALGAAGTLTTDDYGLVETDRPATAVAPATTGSGSLSLLESPVTWVVAVVLLVVTALLSSHHPGNEDGSGTPPAGIAPRLR